MFGYIYAIKVTSKDLFKIGYAADPEIRLRDLQTGNPERLILYKQVRVFWPEEVESLMHATLSYCRVRGEWFEISPTAIDSFFDGLPLPALFSVEEAGPEFCRFYRLVPTRLFGNEDEALALATDCASPVELIAECMRLMESLLRVIMYLQKKAV